MPPVRSPSPASPCPPRRSATRLRSHDHRAGPPLRRPRSAEPSSDGSPIMNLADAAGFFLAAFGQDPRNPMTRETEKGDLGPKYEITYKVPAGNNSELHDPPGRHHPLRRRGCVRAATTPSRGEPIFGMQATGRLVPATRGRRACSPPPAYRRPLPADARRRRSSSAGLPWTGRSEPSCSLCSELQQRRC